jgi:hypothetical protein
MLPTFLFVMTLAAMAAGLTVQAADTMMTLACKGNETSGGPRKSSEVIAIGIHSPTGESGISRIVRV